MTVGTKSKKAVLGAVIIFLALSMSIPPVHADEVNRGVFAIDSRPFGLTYGQWSAKWWQWAGTVTTFDNCPNESGSVWFLGAPTTTSCTIPAHTAILFPTFNAEWSVAEAISQLNSPGDPPGQTCLVPTHPTGTSYAALFTCTRLLADHATYAGASLAAEVDGRSLEDLTDYRAHTTPPPFPFTAIEGNGVGLPPGSSRAVADGFWIMLKPLDPGKHTIHFAASVPFPNVNPPTPPFTFTTAASFCLVVQPSSQQCP